MSERYFPYRTFSKGKSSEKERKLIRRNYTSGFFPRLLVGVERIFLGRFWAFGVQKKKEETPQRNKTQVRSRADSETLIFDETFLPRLKYAIRRDEMRRETF